MKWSLIRNFCVMFGVLLVFPALALSQNSMTSNQSRDVVLLLSERASLVASDENREQDVRFWWHTQGEPSWSESDRELFKALQENGITPMIPKTTNISRIYRRPYLSTSNASALAAVLGARRVFVGHVHYEPTEPIWPLNLEGMKAQIEVHLLMAGAGNATPIMTISMERDVYAHDRALALEELRVEAAQALGKLMARVLQSGPGEIGVQTQSPLIGLRNVGTNASLEAIREAILALDSVEDVRESWASEGIIALEINPGQPPQDDVIEYVARVLENTHFETFQLRRNPSPTSSYLLEFFVQPHTQHRF